MNFKLAKSDGLLACCEFFQHLFEPLHHSCHAIVIEGVGGVFGRVVVGVSEIGGVGDHEGVIALFAEAVVIGAADIADEVGERGAFAGELCAGAEGGDALLYESAIVVVGDEGDEVAGGWIEAGKRGRVFLGVWGIGVIAEHFEAEHGDDVVIFGAGFLCVDPASHFGGASGWEFFVWEEGEADGAGLGVRFECAGEGEDGGAAAGVVVGTGGALGGVVVSADDDDFVGEGCAANCDFEVGGETALCRERMFVDFEADCFELLLEEEGGLGEFFGVIDAALADVGGEVGDGSAKVVGEGLLWFGEGGERARVRAPGH